MSSNKKFIIKLIQSVEKRACVWDSTSDDYSKREKTEKAWKEISAECGKEEVTCKEKWRNVRTGFLRSLKDYLPSGSGASANKKRFYLHDEMQFLLPYVQRNEQSGNLSEIVQELCGESEDQDQADIYPEKSVTENISVEDDLVSVRKRTDTPVTSSGKRGTSLEVNVQQRAKQIKKDVGNTDQAIINYLKERNKQVFTETKEEIALISFFKGIVPDVLSLSVKNQRLFKKKLLDLVHDLHMSEDESLNTANILFDSCSTNTFEVLSPTAVTVTSLSADFAETSNNSEHLSNID